MPIRNSIGAFKVDLNDFAKKMDLDIADARRRVGLEIYEGVIAMTPRKTGRAEKGWNFSDIAPDFTVPPPGEYVGGGNVGPPSNDPFGQSFVANAVPYIFALEYGHSSQAPFGMVRVTLAEVAEGIQAPSGRFR